MLRRFALLSLLVLGCLHGQDGPPPGRKPLRERAAAGDADAQFTLGKNYEAGRGGLKRDFETARHWYRLAAEQGDPWAQASLGLLCRFGKGGGADLVEAYMWFTLAMERTSGPDSGSIAELRDSAGAHMNQDQIEEARKLARAWKPQPARKQ